MAEKTYDIASLGMASYRDLQDINNDEGFENESELDLKSITDPPKRTNYRSEEYLENQSNQLKELHSQLDNVKPQNYLDIFGVDSGDKSEYFNANSSSRFDERMTDYRQGLNAEDWRSRNQSGFQQIASGLGKMAVIAGTTAVDSLVGTVAGIANVVQEAVQGNISKEHWFSDIVNAGVENPVSQYLIGINDKAEEWMPNYYTEEERNTPWYQQFWHANFIGDHFLKNTGFMVGAMLAGMATSGTVSSLTKLGTARNLFKDTAMAVGLGDKTAKQVLSAYKTGKAIGSVEKVSKALADAAKNARNAELITKLVSSAAGSFGESRMEAITNSNDWFKKVKERLDKDRTEGLGQIEQSILRDRPDIFDVYTRFDEQGNIIGYEPVVRDQREFNNEYNRRKEQIENKYNQSLAQATRYRIDYSNASFGINFALTWGENFQLFGDALIGSYSKRSIFNRKVRQAQSNKYATDAAKRTVWEANPAQFAKDVAKGIASPIFEGTQEMWQQGTTLALNRRAGSKINSYYGDVIDKDGLDVGTGYINNFMKALSDTYGDAEQWENFAMGFLTALLPIPSVTKTSSTETGAEDAAEGKGKPKSKITLGGELWESIREARKNREEANALADALNNLENDDRKRNMLMDIIRIDRSNQRQQQALDNGDEKAYKDEEALKLATMIMTYSDAGQMDYLRQLIDEIYTVETPEQVESIRKSTVYKKNNGGTEVEMSVFDGMSDDEIIDYFREQKKKMLGGVDKDGNKVVGVINRYDEIYKNINKVYGDFGMGDKADEYRKQLAFDIMQIDDREDRIKKISGELVDAVRKYADIFKAGIFTDEITPEQQKQLDEINQTIQTLTDISNLNIAIGNEGFLEKLNEIRNSQTDSIEDKAVKILELIEQNNKILDRKYQTGQTREAYNRFRKEHKAARQTDKEYQRTLRNLREKEDEIQQSIESTTQNLKISTKVDDLIRLLGDRESLYNNLAVLSGIGGVDFFFQGMSFDIAYQFDNYAKRYSKKFYDSFAQSHDINDMPKNLYGWFRKIANENNDEDVNGFLDLYDKYMLGENSFLNNDNLSEEMVDGFYDAILYNITNSSSPKEAQENIFKFFNENFDQESEEYIAFNDFEKQWNEKKQAKEEAEEAIKTQEESQGEKEDNTDYFGEFAHKDFDQDKFDQMFSNDQQDPKPIIDFLSKPENEGLSVAIAEMLGYDPDDINVTIVDYLKNVDYNSLLDSMQQQFNVAKQNASNEGSEENPGNTPDDEGAGPAENGQEDESGDENATPAESEGDITPDDANKGTDDGVSNAQKAGNGFVSQNDKPLEKKPKGIRGAAEASIDQKYENQEGVDVQIEGQDKSDTWHVNRYSAKYHIESLVDRASRFLKQMVPSLNKVTAQVLTKELNRRFKMQEFIDSGFLRKVLESGNGQIRFVMLNDDSLVENRNKYEDFKVQAMFGQSIFAAIQIPDSLRDEYDKAGYTLIDFKAADGSVVPMQILGVISPNDISTKSNGQYVDPEFAKFAHSSAQDFARRKQDKYILLNGYSNIEYIYPGRLVKQKDNMHYGQRPIRSILDKEQLENPYGQFQVRLYVDDGGEFIDVGQRMEGDVVPLNMNSFRSEEAYNTGRTRKGSVWIMTKEADGSIYHKGARIASFTNEYYQGHLQSGNAYISGIRGAVLQMINSNGNMDRIKSALHDIQKYLYFTKEHNVLIRPTKKGNFFIINSATKSRAIKLTQDSFDEIMNALLGERFKFAIGATTLKEIVDSDILYTDLAELHNKNASFAISRLVDGQPQKSQFFANNTVREEKGKPKGSPQSQNGNTYHVYANGKPTEYKVFYSDGRIVRVADNRTPTNKALIAVLSDVYSMETSENGLQADDRFRLFNSNYRNVYMTQYDDNGQTRNIAYMVTKSSSGRVSISAFTDPQTDFINGVVNGTVTIDSTNSHIYKEICDKIGKKMNEKEFSQAASGGAGVDENATQGKQVVPKYAVQYPELMDYRFKIGDEVSFRMGEAQLSGIVTAVKEDGSFSVKVNGKRNDIYIHPYATYAFFNKPYGSSSATQDFIEIISKSNEVSMNGLSMLTPDMFKRHGDTQRQGTPGGSASTEGQGQQPRPRIGRRSGGVASLNETVVKKVSQIFQYNYGIENAKKLERIMKQNGLGETPSDLYEKIRSLTQQQIQTFNGKMDNIDDFLHCLESLKC